jgi:hypothetical protein
MLTGFLVMLWSAIHSGDAPMTSTHLALAEIALYLALAIAAALTVMVA